MSVHKAVFFVAIKGGFTPDTVIVWGPLDKGGYAVGLRNKFMETKPIYLLPDDKTAIKWGREIAKEFKIMFANEVQKSKQESSQ